MVPAYLIGGGWQTDGFAHTYGRILAAATRDNERRILIVVAEEPDDDPEQHFLRSRGAFEAAGGIPSEFRSAFVSATLPLTLALLNDYRPTGIFVCGGLTPAYHAALCADRSWLAYLHDTQTPYAGFSAGAAIAASTAIIGGWQVPNGQRTIRVASEETGEDLELLAVHSGLGLVPFAVDVHASQWGTLTRLLHAVEQGLVKTGWAIDEDTLLVNTGDTPQIYGLGQAYHVQTSSSRPGLTVEIVRAKTD